MKRFLNLGISLCILNFAGINKAEVESVDLSRSVVKIMAISPSGKQNMGSGVVIAHNKIATNCHVTRIARRAYIIKEDRLYAVLAQAAIPELDVCILETALVTLPIAPLIPPDNIKTGVDVTISGYPYALGIRTMQGSIIALHPFAEDNIIEINSGFTHGASGGGVFNNNGELIGLMTFMGQSNKHMHYYVVPSSWLAMAVQKKFSPLQPISTLSFWENGQFQHLRLH